MLGEQPCGIGADPEERSMAERDDAGVAEDEVERQREQRGDRDLACEREIVRRDDERQERGEPEDDLQRPPADLLPEMRASVFQTVLRGAISAAPPSPGR